MSGACGGKRPSGGDSPPGPPEKKSKKEEKTTTTLIEPIRIAGVSSTVSRFMLEMFTSSYSALFISTARRQENNVIFQLVSLCLFK